MSTGCEIQVTQNSARSYLAHTTEEVRELESLSARARVGPVEVGAGVGAVVTEALALVEVDALLGIILVDEVSPVAQAEVPAAGQIIAPANRSENV